MATTFQALVKLADFSAPPARPAPEVHNAEDEQDETEELADGREDQPELIRQHRRRPIESPIKTLGGLHYNIQIILPETRDAQVYDVLFRSLKEHLFA